MGFEDAPEPGDALDIVAATVIKQRLDGWGLRPKLVLGGRMKESFHRAAKTEFHSRQAGNHEMR